MYRGCGVGAVVSGVAAEEVRSDKHRGRATVKRRLTKEAAVMESPERQECAAASGEKTRHAVAGLLLVTEYPPDLTLYAEVKRVTRGNRPARRRWRGEGRGEVLLLVGRT